jgi:AraC-like DNA-binding protein
MSLSPLHVASVIAIFQALLMALFSLQNRKSTRASNTILASMLLVFAIMGACSLFKTVVPLKANLPYHRAIFLVDHLAFLIGPLSYFYIKSLLESGFTLRKQDWLHFLPAPAAWVVSLVVFQHYDPFVIWKFSGRVYFSAAVLLQNLAYLPPALKVLQAHGLTWRSFLSYIDNSRLAWVRFFVCGYIVLWIVQFQIFLSWDAIVNPPWCPYARSLYFLTTFLFFNGMVYLGLKKPEIFHQGQKYQHSILKSSDKDHYRAKLASMMDQEKLYLQPDLTLAEVARKLELHPLYVSQLINESFQQNFRDYLNRYRVEESKRLLIMESQRLNILGVALDTGFNSKSAFNRAFKKHTGSTPKEYKRRTPAN